MKQIPSVLLGAVIVIIFASIDLFAITLLDRLAVQAVGRIGHVYGASLLFLPKLAFGIVVGLVAGDGARRLGAPSTIFVAAIGFAAYYFWKFQVVEVWIAHEVLAWSLALGPYLGFFVGYFGGALTMLRARSAQ